MAALEMSDMRALWDYIEDIRMGNPASMPAQTWVTASETLKNLIDDRTALYAACVAVSAVEGESESKALTDAAITASDLLLT